MAYCRKSRDFGLAFLLFAEVWVVLSLSNGGGYWLRLRVASSALQSFKKHIRMLLVKMCCGYFYFRVQSHHITSQCYERNVLADTKELAGEDTNFSFFTRLRTRKECLGPSIMFSKCFYYKSMYECTHL